MSVDPNLLVIKPVSELEEVTGLQPGSLLFYNGDEELKVIDIDTFNNISKSAIPISPTDTAPTLAGLYKPTIAGTYTNAGGLIAQNGYSTLFFYNGSSWTKSEEKFPETQYNTTVLNPVTTNIAETGKTVSDYVTKRVSIQDALFQKTLIDNGVKQPTAGGTPTNQTVGTKTGISMSIGVVSNPFDKVTIKFAQTISTPVTQIEIRLFEGKTAGGTLIAKKRVTITAPTTAQVVTTVAFDSVIYYDGEMWCQILMNNPFEYYKLTSGFVRASAAGYGQPTYTTVNNLDGTSFPTNLAYADLFLEFNTLIDDISLTTAGSNLLGVKVSTNFDPTTTIAPQGGKQIADRYDPYLMANEPFYYTTNGAVLSSIPTNRTIVRNQALTRSYNFKYIQIYAFKAGVIQVGIFEKPASTTMKAVLYSSEITITAGNQTIALPETLTAASGQYIGVFCKTAQIYVDTSKAGQLGGDRVYTSGKIDLNVTQTTVGTSNYDLFSLFENFTLQKQIENISQPKALGNGTIPSSNAISISNATPNPLFLKDSWVVNGVSINQPLHPTVMAFPGGFNEYKYVMVQTPYPQSGNDVYKDRYECPFLHFSNDRINWTAGVLMDDLTAEEIAAESYLSDPDLVFNTDTNQLEVWYRITHRAARATEGTTIGTQLLRKIINTNGTFSSREVLMTEAQMSALAGEIRSMGMLYEGGVYKMWFTGLSGGNVGYAQSATPTNISSWTVSPVTMTGQLANCWHLDVVRDGTDIWLINDTVNFDLHLFKWVSNTQFTFVKVLLERTNNPKDYYGKVVYRSSGIIESGWYSLFISGWNDDGGRGVASVGLMEGDSFSNLKHVDGNFPRHDRRIQGNITIYNGLLTFPDGAAIGYDPVSGEFFKQKKDGSRTAF